MRHLQQNVIFIFLNSNHLYSYENETCYPTNKLYLIKCSYKLVGIDWSLLSSLSNAYTHCFSLIGVKIQN